MICTDKHADTLPITGKHVIFTPLDNRWQNADNVSTCLTNTLKDSNQELKTLCLNRPEN